MPLPEPPHGPPPAGGVFAGTSIDVRTLLHFRIDAAAAQALLPEGWLPAPADDGPGAGANLRLTFVETLVARDAQDEPAAAACYLLVGVPARRRDGNGHALVLGTGLSPLGGGPYGANMKASARLERKVHEGVAGGSREETWHFGGEGASAHLHLAHAAAPAAPEAFEQQVLSRQGDLRLYRCRQASVVVHDPARRIDRRSAFELQLAGVPFERLFDGRERLLGVVAVPSYARTIFRLR